MIPYQPATTKRDLRPTESSNMRTDTQRTEPVAPASSTMQFKNLTFRGKIPEDRPKKKAPAVVFRQSIHPLPYFAHQQLDLEYFPRGKSGPRAVSSRSSPNIVQMSVDQLGDRNPMAKAAIKRGMTTTATQEPISSPMQMMTLIRR